MEYQNRLVCFIDLLGFGDAIKQSVTEPKLAERFYELFNEFSEGGLEKALYSYVPYLDEQGLTTAGERYAEKLMERSDAHYDLVATQFSDSFVISAPADNGVSCHLLIKALRIIHLHFFTSVGMLMRGGISLGQLVHQRGGALFGPAMNEAYLLESKSAVYARVIISKSAEACVAKAAAMADLEPTVFSSFDGFQAMDLVSFKMNNSFLSDEEFEDQLNAVEQDTILRASHAHPKIAYLQSRWKGFSSLKIDA